MSMLRTIDKRLWWILALAAFFIFFRISHVDMTGDDAHYSARAIGLADFMFGDAAFQSTPLLWYEQFPWWARMSFHDHPILLFLIQHVFLSVNDSVFFAKLPYALFALASIALVYLWMRRLQGERAALIASLLFALHAHVLWTGRVSFMEAGVIFFILLSFLACARFLEDRRRWWEFGAALGLALSAKFTTLFLLPAILVYLCISHRKIFLEKYLYLALAAAFIIFSPTIFYNLFMERDTGHFSLQFARLFGQTSPWQFGGVTTDYAAAAAALIKQLGEIMSWPYFAAWMISIAYVVWKKRPVTLPLGGLAFLAMQQWLIGQVGYVLAPFAIFAAAITGAAFAELPQTFLRPATVAFAAYLFIFAVNSHTLARHAGPVGWLRSAATSDNYGVYQLDRYLTTLLGDQDFGKHDIFWYVKVRHPGLRKYLANISKEALEEQRKHAAVILYDGNISWFSRVWLFERRRFYNNVPMISTNEQHLLDQLTVADFYLIVATDKAPLDAEVNRNDTATLLARQIFRDAEPVVIARDDGEVAFKVYHADKKKLQESAS